MKASYWFRCALRAVRFTCIRFRPEHNVLSLTNRHPALIALRTKALNFEKARGYGQRECFQNGVHWLVPAIHHKGGEGGAYEGGGPCPHQKANGLRETDARSEELARTQVPR